MVNATTIREMSTTYFDSCLASGQTRKRNGASLSLACVQRMVNALLFRELSTSSQRIGEDHLYPNPSLCCNLDLRHTSEQMQTYDQAVSGCH